MIDEEKYLADLKEKILAYYPVSEESFLLVKSLVRFQVYQKDEILLMEGRIARDRFFICKGAVIAFFIDENANTYNKNIFLEGDFAGSVASALSNTPSQFTLQAVEESIVMVIDDKKYKQLVYSHDDLKNFYIAYLEKNWVIDKEKREISLVMENATTRYLKLLDTHPNIDRRIPLQHIASHLGITPTQLSRIRKDLK